MTVDNFEKIKNIVTFDSDDDFYMLQILKRKKENPDQKKHVKLIDTLFIYSMEDMDKLKEKTIKLCTVNNARAYFRINKRSLKTVALQTLRLIADQVSSGEYKASKKAYISCAGKFPTGSKLWILDIDDPSEEQHVLDFINESKKNIVTESTILGKSKISRNNSGITVVANLKTINGVHLIVKPFNPVAYNKEFTGFSDDKKNVSIHKDSPTLLYFA